MFLLRQCPESIQNTGHKISFGPLQINSLFDDIILGLIDCMVLRPFSIVFQLYHSVQCAYPCFSGVLVASTPLKILSKPLAAFPLKHCRNNGKW